MPELPKISGKKAIQIFEKLGFSAVRQRGSHVILRKDSKGCVIPLHKSLAIGTLKSAIRQTGLDTEDFLIAYNR
jgi:predicted RNA binding protein YcfA (HicA-like mRNA interferase family)